MNPRACWKWVGLLALPMLWSCTTPSGETLGETSPTEAADAPARTDERAPAAQAGASEAPVQPGTITSVDLQRLLDLQDAGKVLLVDVRPGLFYAMGHIPEAISLPKMRFETEFPKKKTALDQAVAAGRIIVLYCTNADCPDGYAVATQLTPQGYSVTLYTGGWEEWQMAGF